MKRAIILYEGSPLVSVDPTEIEFILPSQLLDWYSQEYAFERHKLGIAYVRDITYVKI